MLEVRPRRRWERYDVTIGVNIETVLNGQLSTFTGQSCDISKGGLRLFLTRELDLGTSLRMEFVLPYHSAEFVIRGVVRSRNGFMHGIEFISPTDAQQQMIERTCGVFALLR